MRVAKPVPSVAVIFISKLQLQDEAYAESITRLKELGGQQPGFLGIESARAPDGRGITVVFYDTAESARVWGKNPEHRSAMKTGQEKWYEYYELYYANVVKGHAWSSDAGT